MRMGARTGVENPLLLETFKTSFRWDDNAFFSVLNIHNLNMLVLALLYCEILIYTL